MNAFSGRLSQTALSLYAWMASLLLGAVLMDVLYARGMPAGSLASGEMADGLLLLGGVTALAGMGAILLAQQAGRALLYLVASLAVLSLGFLGPVMFVPFLPDTPGAGAGLRIVIHGLASLQAWIGLGRFFVGRASEIS